ncbi:26S proteasome non-ATPase regulatory subunit 10-like [Hydractinia symbiolongicarpus]|uniref:26S proteasome non-ATPase regulatory subunit 10-like n=1 Tax=Hydractinia symbiolongicarpus TaxID=13093 RepID=UPI00254A101D|nr:26S proteasome non-ATPase regulatory subunit 10-like [Hydractinia symbiolongicarpus]
MDDWDEADLVPSLFENAAEMKLSNFCIAAQEGNIEKLQQMLDQKQVRDINMQSPKKKETALLYACRGGQLKAVNFLVEHGADVNLKDIRGKHSLHLASSGGFLEIVKYLINQKAKLDVVDKYGRSCLHWAATNKHYDIAVLLLESGAPVTYSISNNWQPLHEAAKSNEVQILQLLMKNGAHINNPVTDNKPQPFSPLHIAAREGSVECLKLLLENKAVVNAVNRGKSTALHEAAFKGSKECCRELILHGADPHARNNLERTPLLEACNRGNLQAAILLLDAGCFVNRPDRVGDTALHHLLRHNQERLTAEQLAGFTDILLQYGAKMNTVGTDDETPLMLTQRMMEKDVYDVMCTAMEKPRSLLHCAKIMCRKIVCCQYENIKNFPIPKNLQIYLLQNSKYYSGW